jgi:hypothetical protein
VKPAEQATLLPVKKTNLRFMFRWLDSDKQKQKGRVMENIYLSDF